MIATNQISSVKSEVCACQKASVDAGGDVSACPRRRAVARAARELIVEKGLEGLRTRDIAQRAGINIATLHYHVPSKEALIYVVADSVRDELTSREAAPLLDRATGRQKLRQKIDVFADLIANRGDLLVVMSAFSERERRDPAVNGIFSEMRSQWHKKLAEIIALGSADGSLRADIDATQSAHILISSLIGAARRAEIGSHEFADYFDQLEKLFSN